MYLIDIVLEYNRNRRRRKWATIDKHFIYKWIHGLKLQLYPGDETSKILYCNGNYEPLLINWVQQEIKPFMVVIDAGANMGLYSLVISRLVGDLGRVYAFEPSDRDYGRLVRNIKLNRIRNVIPYRWALFDSDTTLELLIAEDNHTGHNTIGKQFGAKEVRLKRKERIKTMTVDGLNLNSLDFMKIDVEGAELHVLKGAIETIQRRHPTILIEVTDGTLKGLGNTGKQVCDWLRQEGYHLYEVGSDFELLTLPDMDKYSMNMVAKLDIKTNP